MDSYLIGNKFIVCFSFYIILVNELFFVWSRRIHQLLSSLDDRHVECHHFDPDKKCHGKEPKRQHIFRFIHQSAESAADFAGPKSAGEYPLDFEHNERRLWAWIWSVFCQKQGPGQAKKCNRFRRVGFGRSFLQWRINQCTQKWRSNLHYSRRGKIHGTFTPFGRLRNRQNVGKV